VPLAKEPEPSPRADAGDRALWLRVAVWLVPFAILGTLLVRLYPDSYQQDGGYHFLFARFAFAHPQNLVNVWGRPLFTALYAVPARLGYPVAKLFTVLVSLGAAATTAQLARQHGLKRAELAVPLLFSQPSFLLLSSETMTEPLFALVLGGALWLNCAGRFRASLWAASLLPLVRPEGFFVALLFGAVIALDRRAGPTLFSRVLSTARLAAGLAAWWLLALLLTRDPLFILHNWPRNWDISASKATGSLLQYFLVRDELLAGPVLEALFVLGLFALLAARRALFPLAALGLVAGLHSVFFRFGLFGSAGYARYLVCVSPAMALATLCGFEVVAGFARNAPRGLTRAATALVLLWAAGRCLSYVDGFGSSRDARAVSDAYAWFLSHPRPVSGLVFSQAYMAIAFGRDPAERPRLGADRAGNMELLRSCPPGTLVFWDAHTGPRFHGIGPEDIERAGYERFFERSYALRPIFAFLHPSDESYTQVLSFYYKPEVKAEKEGRE